MVFTSYIFVFYFLTLVLAGYYALPARSTWRNAWLLVTTPGKLALMAVAALLLCSPRQAHEWSESLTWPKALVLAPTFAVALMTMFSQAANPFLYFQF